MKQCTLIVLDSVGIGELPDAAEWGDTGSDTLGNMARAVGGLKVPNLAALGLGNIRADDPIEGCEPVREPQAAFGKMTEVAHGKDTATGHWEFMGLVLEEPFQTFPDGFPAALIEGLCEALGVSGVLGNVAASGTQIIKELGPQHVESGLPIVYTSADPVLQIAAHEDVVPIETLYAWCEKAFELAIPAGLSRVIARPFVGSGPEDYTRTHRRKDFALAPPRDTILNELERAGVQTLGVGKIPSIYSDSGIASGLHTRSNEEGVAFTLEAMKERTFPFVFTNLVDFDQSYGHRRNPQGYADCLARFDEVLPELLEAMGDDDLMIITADHGNDPTYRGTDHTREYVPVLLVGAGMSRGRDLGVRATFADVGKTVAAFFGVESAIDIGTSMLG